MRGVVSLGDYKRSSEYSDHRDEALGLDIKVYGSEKGWDDMPHQKLLVVDGLLAFTGSTNLTIRGLRGAAKGRDHMELITDVAKVIEGP